MDQQKITNYKKALETEKAKLISDLKSVGHINPDNKKDWEATATEMDNITADPNDVADNIEEFETNTAIVNPLETRLGEVNEALKRIEAGHFGLCEVCKNEIEVERLIANPAATTCIKHL